MRRFSAILLFLVGTGLALAQAPAPEHVVPTETTDIHFTSHAQSISMDFLQIGSDKSKGHADLTLEEWKVFTDGCRKALDVPYDPNDPDYLKVEQKEMASAGPMKVWRLIEPQSSPAIILSENGHTVADVDGKYVYVYMKTLKDLSTEVGVPFGK